MRLYVIRHGETQWNRERKLAGWSDIPLNDTGIKLAKETAEGLKDVPFDLCISSPLRRARMTAEIILGNRDVMIAFDERIKEINFGEYEGVSCVKPGNIITVPEYEKFQKDPLNFEGMPGGESIKDVIKRANEAFRDYCTNPDLQDKTILIATHGCLYRAFLNSLYDDPSDFWQAGVPKNCAVSIVEVEDGKPKLLESDLLFYDPSLALKYF
jgi:broad specificity phosphatase PhoE